MFKIFIILNIVGTMKVAKLHGGAQDGSDDIFVGGDVSEI